MNTATQQHRFWKARIVTAAIVSAWLLAIAYAALSFTPAGSALVGRHTDMIAISSFLGIFISGGLLCAGFFGSDESSRFDNWVEEHLLPFLTLSILILVGSIFCFGRAAGSISNDAEAQASTLTACAPDSPEAAHITDLLRHATASGAGWSANASALRTAVNRVKDSQVCDKAFKTVATYTSIVPDKAIAVRVLSNGVLYPEDVKAWRLHAIAEMREGRPSDASTIAVFDAVAKQ